MVHWSQGERHQSDSSMTLRWRYQCREGLPQSTRQQPILFMPSNCKGLCGCWLLFPQYVWTHMKTSSKNRPLKHWVSTVQRHVYSAAQQGTSNADGPPQGADISSKPRDNMQKNNLETICKKIEGKDTPKVALFSNAKKPSNKPVYLAYQHRALIKANLWRWWVRN